MTSNTLHWGDIMRIHVFNSMERDTPCPNTLEGDKGIRAPDFRR